MNKIISFYSSFDEGNRQYDFYKMEVFEDSEVYEKLVDYIDEMGLEYEIGRYNSGYATIVVRALSCQKEVRPLLFDKFGSLKNFEFEGNVTLKSSHLYRIFKRLESF